MSFECISGEGRRWARESDGCFCSLANSCSCRNFRVLELSLHYIVHGKWHWASSSLLLACMGGNGAKRAVPGTKGALHREDKRTLCFHFQVTHLRGSWLCHIFSSVHAWKCDSCWRLKFLLPSSLSSRILATLQWPMSPRLWSGFTMGRCAARRTSLEHLSERSSKCKCGGAEGEAEGHLLIGQNLEFWKAEERFPTLEMLIFCSFEVSPTN